MEEYKVNPVRFVNEVIGVRPTMHQLQLLEAISKPGAKVSIKSGHGCGKTSGLSWIILWFLCTHSNCRIPCTAPSSHQLNDLLWPEIVRWKDQMHPYFKDQLEYSADKFWVRGVKETQYAVARTARPEKPEALQGFHAPNLLFVIDEASGVAEQIFEVAEGALSTEGARVIMTSNPTRTDGYFYRSQTKERKYWDCLHFSCLDSHLVSDIYPKSMADRYGEDSSVYAVRVLGQFPDSSDDTVIPLHYIERAVGRDVDYSMSPKIAGLDVARKGDDATAITVTQGNKVIYLDRWYNKDLMQTVGRIKALYDDKVFHKIHVDAIGMGAGVADRLNELGVPTVLVNVSESTAYKEKYTRLRDELWWQGREFFEDLSGCIDPDIKHLDDLIGELSSVKYDFSSNGKIKVESKEEMKKRGEESPNLADSFLLTRFRGKREMRMRKGKVNFRRAGTGGWT
jgi:hypothetical protein